MALPNREKKVMVIPLVLLFTSQFVDTNTLVFAQLQTDKLVSSDPVIQNYWHPVGWRSQDFGRWGKGCLVFLGGIFPFLAFLFINFFPLK